MNSLHTAAPRESDTLGQEKLTPAEIIREAMQGRRRPLRGRALVTIGRKIGLDWADTGTGLKPRTGIKTTDGAKYLVMPTGSLVRVQLDEKGRPHRPAAKASKKERNRQKRDARLAAESATARSAA